MRSAFSMGLRFPHALSAYLIAACPCWPGSALGRAPSCEQAESLVLSNGIEVRLRPDPAMPTVAVVLSVHAGARNDPPGREGLAHYVELLTSRIAPPFAAVDDLEADAGAVGVGSRTMPDTTDYFEVVPAEQLELALWIEARRLGLGLDTLSEQVACDGRQLLVREQAQGFGGTEVAFDGTLKFPVFPDGHPYHRHSVAPQADSRLTLTDARWFFARYYRPARLRLALVGGFDAERVKPLLARLFGDFRPRQLRAGDNVPDRKGDVDGAAELECLGEAASAAFEPRRIVVPSATHDEAVNFYWPVPRGEDAERSLRLLSVLGTRVGESARQIGLSTSVAFGADAFELAPLLYLNISVLPGQPLAKAEALVREEAARLATSLSDPAELEKARQYLELSEALRMREPRGRALNLVRRECVPAQCRNLVTELTPDSLRGVVRFDPSKAVIVEERAPKSWPPGAVIGVLVPGRRRVRR